MINFVSGFSCLETESFFSPKQFTALEYQWDEGIKKNWWKDRLSCQTQIYFHDYHWTQCLQFSTEQLLSIGRNDTNGIYWTFWIDTSFHSECVMISGMRFLKCFGFFSKDFLLTCSIDTECALKSHCKLYGIVSPLLLFISIHLIFQRAEMSYCLTMHFLNSTIAHHK